MKNVLVIGAGQSTPFLIRYLLEHAERHDWFITVGDRDQGLARRRVGDHARGTATALDVNDAAHRAMQIANAHVVVNMMPQGLQPMIAWDCVQHRRHMVSVSHQDEQVQALRNDANRAGILLLTDVGLDPGIDLMSAMSLIHRVRQEGGVVESFESYGSGVPVPEADVNPLRYCITWNPRNVVMSAEFGAQYRRNGKVTIVPWHHVFQDSWPIEVEGVGHMEAYPNRDSLAYEQPFGLEGAHTLIRGTLRYPGWCETWLQIVRLGLPAEHIRIPDLAERSYADIVEMFVPAQFTATTLEQRVASFLNINPTGQIIRNLRWLGLFSEQRSGAPGDTVADAMVHLLNTRLALPPDVADLVIILHSLLVRYPQDGDRRDRIVATFTHRGEPGAWTAMAKTVGLPAALATKLLLEDRIPLTGCGMPTHEMIHGPILEELEAEGMTFQERVFSLDGSARD